ncbi:alpha/beta hydrolase [Saccharopolyspora sp. 5N708]|uniref:alpha/beta hydrolase n=1 Tax=Saccharopolyspora sp. 5N708 TaxID=3457424 RepID=UPI003FD5316D
MLFRPRNVAVGLMLALGVAVVPGAQASPSAAPTVAAQDIVDVPVSFQVRNINRSAVGCPTDGKTYTIRGHLTAPRQALAARDRSITLYQHGIASGEWYWRLPVDGYNHVQEMAERGQASLTINRIGYDSSDKPDGILTCIGAQADMTHQIIQQLRSGRYAVESDQLRPPTFDRIAVAGHSNGGQVAQITAYSFQDVDAVIIMAWTDLGLTPQAFERFSAATQKCLPGGEPSEAPGDPSGYIYYDNGTEEFLPGNFNDAEQAVLDAAAPLQNRHPCQDMLSQLGGVMIDIKRIPEITVPVYFMYGENDARVVGGEEHRALFTGAESTEMLVVPGGGHYFDLDRNGPMAVEGLSTWLRNQNFGITN